MPATKRLTPWLMLFARTGLFLGIQAVFALFFLLSGSETPWIDSASWWPITVAIADLVCLGLLLRLFRSEGKRYWEIFRMERQHIKSDLLALLGLTVLTAPVTYLPNIWLGQALFGSAEATLDLFVRPLPYWAVYAALIAFPILQGISETGAYFGYVMPRLEAQGIPKWLAITAPALMLGFQHAAMPLLLDGRFVIWRACMYLPFAFLTGIAFHWRPRLLPYFAIIHILMNMSFFTMFLAVAY